ncbi:hypothetical protein CDAR_466681 [Caerostris darwini]|uniref:Uncharacterized protein n=1 Tax=Caerostris darwini TaxID=1538125 RepID=A0AAV4T3V8_9ARAC|nr:hypothetical protein CDAR_466681 [Caerostris darwini]
MLPVMHSLKHLSLVRVVLTLINNDAVRGVFNSCNFSDEEGKRNKIVLTSQKVVSELHIPYTLKEDLVNYIGYLLAEFKEWVLSYIFYFDKQPKVQFTNMCWKSIGRIDVQKRTRAILEDESVAIEQRFRLACVSRLRDDICSLWNEMSEKQRNKESQFPVTQWVPLQFCDKADALNLWENPILQDLLSGEDFWSSTTVHRLLQLVSPEERRAGFLLFLTSDEGGELHDMDLFHALDEEGQWEVTEYFYLIVLSFYFHWSLRNPLMNPKDKLFASFGVCELTFLARYVLCRIGTTYMDEN